MDSISKMINIFCTRLSLWFWPAKLS